MTEGQQTSLSGQALTRAWASRILLGVNCAVLGVLIFLICRPASLPATWDGPAVATVALTVAALVVASVGIGVGLLAVWGYTTLREHAGNIATKVAAEAADKAADRKVQQLAKEWGFTDDAPGGEEVAQAYSKE